MSGLASQHDSIRGRLSSAYRQACLSELDALKPGNVHRFSAGHGMTLEDFITSANVSAEPLTAPELGLGERIYKAVKATREAVGCNTNLGILMLCAPMIQAAYEWDRQAGSFRDKVRKVLLEVDAKEMEWLFRAIRLAAPGGLGKSDKHDVFQTPSADLLEVMAHASDRDQIARQYVTGFSDLFDFALPQLHSYQARWQSKEWATTALFLWLLAKFPDTHIRRKRGLYKAVATGLHASELLNGMFRVEQPEHYQSRLLQADIEFKREGVNPGTSADLTVTTLFISHLETVLFSFEKNTGFTRVRDSRPQEVGIQS
jgi:triphosphoribosyl-dephospho-CoA synthase